MKTLAFEEQLTLLEAMVDGSNVATIVTDPSQEDNPIIYTNRTFEKMTGYQQSEVLGRNCRFLQRKETDPKERQKIRTAIEARESVTVTLQNYRKDGSLFWNRLHIEPVEVMGALYFIGTQTDVTLEHNQRQELTEKELEIEQIMLPILSLQDHVAAVALIGNMTHHRFDLLISKLSLYVQKERIEHVMIDVTGLYWEEGFPLEGLLSIRDVLKLMGTHLYVTGISPKAARELGTLQDQRRPLLTFSSIQQAMAFSQNGIR
ncbi:PAS domain S-box protein [Planomicrobium chinense]|uniref:PAS domain S-box protein n=1 Tax=Planococcus chinensis TaxID=272917 RepID=UPI001CC3E581|nr:STAS domain-containing protein [Planococcus chinensis]MBZ5201499.1 PAS domain S-box protein [Planococcus chinensis]